MAKVSDIIAKSKAKDDDEAEDSGVDFYIPDGYDVPDGVEPGDEFTAVATFELDEDEPGKMVLTKLDGIPVTNEPPAPEEPAAAPTMGPPGGATMAPPGLGI
jgi:hypothetical protein